VTGRGRPPGPSCSPAPAAHRAPSPPDHPAARGARNHPTWKIRADRQSPHARRPRPRSPSRISNSKWRRGGSRLNEAAATNNTGSWYASAGTLQSTVYYTNTVYNGAGLLAQHRRPGRSNGHRSNVQLQHADCPARRYGSLRLSLLGSWTGD
jgi:hypothetical protein